MGITAPNNSMQRTALHATADAERSALIQLHLSLEGVILKRIFDIGCASALLARCAPLMGIIAILIRHESAGPIILLLVILLSSGANRLWPNLAPQVFTNP